MLRSRLSVSLLMKERSLVKSRKFKSFKYIGDPINTVRTLNEKLVDELIILDIEATKLNKKIDFEYLKIIAAKSRMPIAYGGGIKTVEDVEKLISIGIEKVIFGTVAFENSQVLTKAIESVGAQSVCVILDLKKSRFSSEYRTYIRNGRKKIRIDLEEIIRKFTEMGVGELIFQSIERDGMMTGYDLKLVEKIHTLLKCPFTVLGGAKSLDSIKELDQLYGPLGIAASSIYIFKGPLRAVLINYPNNEEKINLLSFKN